MQSLSSCPEDINDCDLIVERYDPDFNDLAWQTSSLLTEGLDLQHPGPDEAIARLFRLLLGKVSPFRPGTLYANPCGVVRSLKADLPFLRQARQLQQEWFGRFNRVLASASRVKREMEKVDPIIKQLTHTGVMIIDNRHVFPSQWPDRIQSSLCEHRISTGTRFGRLVVLESLPKGKLRCRCDCNNVAIKKRKHLLSGETKSCGCLQAEHQRRQQDRRNDRRWKLTGELSR